MTTIRSGAERCLILLCALLLAVSSAHAAKPTNGSFATFRDLAAQELDERSAEVPILLYHHIAEEASAASAVSVEAFDRQMESLVKAGYTAITFAELQAYVSEEAALPEKPILITFDDGYESNYTHAYPILEKHGLKATIFVIGVSVGKDTYKDTDKAMTPHFSWEQAAEMEASGVITVESHGYDFHEVPGLDEDPIRKGILRKPDEAIEDYINFLTEDCTTMNTLFQEHLQKPVSVVAYPHGKHDLDAHLLMVQNGIPITVTTEPKTNTIVQDCPQTLYNLGRYTVGENTDLLKLIGN